VYKNIVMNVVGRNHWSAIICKLFITIVL